MKNFFYFLLVLISIATCTKNHTNIDQPIQDTTMNMGSFNSETGKEKYFIQNIPFDTIVHRFKPIIKQHYGNDEQLVALFQRGIVADTFFSVDEHGVIIDREEYEMERTQLFRHPENNQLLIERDYPHTNSSYDQWMFQFFSLNDTIRCIFMKTTGVTSFFSTDELKVYKLYTDKKEFILDKAFTESFDLGIDQFFKPETPDSVMHYVHNNLQHQFTFSEKGLIEHYYYSPLLSDEDIYNEWALGDHIRYNVVDGKWIKSNPYWMMEEYRVEE